MLRPRRAGSIRFPALGPSPLSHPALSIRGLKFRYADSGPWTVDIPALDLKRGEQMLLTGGSGKGKSTLLQLIAGLLDPAEGHIVIAGERMHTKRGAARDLYRGRMVGMIFQTFNLLHGFTALENVMTAMMFSLMPRHEHRPRAEKLLKHLGIDRPGAMVDQLSVGQQQRVAVARALACDPVLVLADEPTASLDPENSAAAMGLIQSACREKDAALLCTSHDPSMRGRFALEASLADLAAGHGPKSTLHLAGEP
jgi:ABC-type lipoprotein export system ATPase subunit